ncbi:MAG: ribosomal-processing cysteine protease Prp [Oscillospiraceae bacterium]|nr:ribosomal-processing cysteine protease Prp [Oscillospiraceae bacterium]
MTRVKMDWRRLVLDMDGHAGSGMPGKDIVCAGESAIAQALLQTLGEMEEERKLGMVWTGGPETGNLHIEAAPAEGYRDTVEALFRMMVTGLKLLEDSYPEYIMVEEDR